jgi:acyl-CoA synthetase (NDP forming)
VERLRKVGILRAENPVDLWPPRTLSDDEMFEKYVTAIDAFVKDVNVDGIVILYESFKEIHFDFRRMLKSVNNLDSKPIVIACIQLENNLAIEVTEAADQFGIPLYFDDIHQAVTALRHYREKKLKTQTIN